MKVKELDKLEDDTDSISPLPYKLKELKKETSRLESLLGRRNADQVHPSEKEHDKEDDGRCIERAYYREVDGNFTLHNWKSKYNRQKVYRCGITADDYQSKNDKAKGDLTDKYDKYDHFLTPEDLKKAK